MDEDQIDARRERERVALGYPTNQTAGQSPARSSIRTERGELMERIRTWFEYHAPESQDQVMAYEQIREAGRLFALVIASHTPTCADQTAAIRKVREAVMTANAAVACQGM